MPKRTDPLQVQVALKIKLPPGKQISPRVLQQILDRAVNNEPLPRSVEFNGIFWRNPARKGSLAHWRWHVGANLDKVAPKDIRGNRHIDGVPVEETPRGDLRQAVDTLSGALFAGVITF